MAEALISPFGSGASVLSLAEILGEKKNLKFHLSEQVLIAELMNLISTLISLQFVVN